MARSGPVGPVWRSPLSGVDRKSPTQGQTNAIDSNVWSGRVVQETLVDAG